MLTKTDACWFYKGCVPLFLPKAPQNKDRLLQIAQAVVLASRLLAQILASWLGMPDKWDQHFPWIQSTCGMYSLIHLTTREWRWPLSHATNIGECIYKIERWCEIVCAVCHPSCMKILLIDHLKCLTCCAISYRIGHFVFKRFMKAIMIANANGSKAENSNLRCSAPLLSCWSGVCGCSYHNSSYGSLLKYVQRQRKKRIVNNFKQYQSSVVVR